MAAVEIKLECSAGSLVPWRASARLANGPREPWISVPGKTARHALVGLRNALECVRLARELTGLHPKWTARGYSGTGSEEGS